MVGVFFGDRKIVGTDVLGVGAGCYGCDGQHLSILLPMTGVTGVTDIIRFWHHPGRPNWLIGR